MEGEKKGDTEHFIRLVEEHVLILDDFEQEVWAHGDGIGGVVVEDGLYFQLFPSDSRVRRFEVDEELLSDRDLQWIGHTDA